MFLWPQQIIWKMNKLCLKIGFLKVGDDDNAQSKVRGHVCQLILVFMVDL